MATASTVPTNRRRACGSTRAKLLIDPYAKAIDGAIDGRAANTLPYRPGHGEDADLQLDDTDDAAAIPRGVVIDPRFDWGDDRPLGRSWSSTIIYETHVKGFTMRHPDVPERLRGTYAGLASEPAIEYLQSVGITAVELLPVHQIADESFLIDKGLSNYWGYSSIGYFAPHGAYSSAGTGGEQVREFKAMVKALHSAGIEVILDVVFNHTAEGNHLGPMLSFKGIDNPGYYRLTPEAPRYEGSGMSGETVEAGGCQRDVARVVAVSAPDRRAVASRVLEPALRVPRRGTEHEEKLDSQAGGGAAVRGVELILVVRAERSS